MFQCHGQIYLSFFHQCCSFVCLAILFHYSFRLYKIIVTTITINKIKIFYFHFRNIFFFKKKIQYPITIWLKKNCSDLLVKSQLPLLTLLYSMSILLKLFVFQPFRFNNTIIIHSSSVRNSYFNHSDEYNMCPYQSSK